MFGIKKNRRFLTFLLIVLSFNAYGMDRPNPEEQKFWGWTMLVGGVLLGLITIKQLLSGQPNELPELIAAPEFITLLYPQHSTTAIAHPIQQPSEPFSFTALSPELQYHIIALLATHTTATSPDIAAYTINSLAQTNKELNAMINNPIFCLQLIKHLAKRFDCSDYTICALLHTQEAQHRMALQKDFYELCMNTKETKKFLQDQFAMLCQNGADLEFTYTIKMHNHSTNTEDEFNVTSLMLASMENYVIVPLLLEQGVNINATNTNGTTALMLAARARNLSAIKIICADKNLNVNQQDAQGNTALIYSLLPASYHYATIIFAVLTQSILNAGADPELANNNHETPLSIAQNANNQGILKLITLAIHKKYRKQ
jgi:ankyrin repeat protein